jgi:hypothetical protein
VQGPGFCQRFKSEGCGPRQEAVTMEPSRTLMPFPVKAFERSVPQKTSRRSRHAVALSTSYG